MIYRSVYRPLEKNTISKKNKQNKQNKNSLDTVTVLMLGIDTDDERSSKGDGGRSDTIVVASHNFKTNKTKMISIPRDTLVNIDYLYGDTRIKYDKINAAYAYGGIDLASKKIEELLDTNIDYYVTINMDGMAQIVDAVGGVKINNTIEFTLNGENFSKGIQTLNGERAVQYSRMRYEDPQGDYGRQKRQREVLNSLLEKITSSKNPLKYKSILTVIADNGYTNIDWPIVKKMLFNYSYSDTEITSIQIHGTSYTGDGVIGQKGISYEKVSAEELARIKKEMEKK